VLVNKHRGYVTTYVYHLNRINSRNWIESLYRRNGYRYYCCM